MSPQLYFPTAGQGPASCHISWLPHLRSWRESLTFVYLGGHLTVRHLCVTGPFTYWLLPFLLLPTLCPLEALWFST